MPSCGLQNIICQTIVQHCHAPDFELTAICCVKLRLSLYIQIQTLNSEALQSPCIDWFSTDAGV